jgi:hypothetical protein
VAEWHFDEGTGNVVKDSSGNGNDGYTVKNTGSTEISDIEIADIIPKDLTSGENVLLKL